MKQTGWLEITQAVNKMEKSQHFLLNKIIPWCSSSLGTITLFIPYGSYWWVTTGELLLVSTTGELLNQAAFPSFNYNVSTQCGRLGQRGGKSEVRKVRYIYLWLILLYQRLLQIPLLSDIFRLKSVGEAWEWLADFYWGPGQCCDPVRRCQIAALLGGEEDQTMMSDSSLHFRKFPQVLWSSLEPGAIFIMWHHVTMWHADMLTCQEAPVQYKYKELSLASVSSDCSVFLFVIFRIKCLQSQARKHQQTNWTNETNWSVSLPCNNTNNH